MKLFLICLLLLPFADIVVTASIKAQKESVLNFLHDALAATTERTAPANITAQRNPLCTPVTEEDSEDMSDAKSTESSETYRCPDKNGDESRDLSKDPNSDEIVIPEVVAKDKAPSRKPTGEGKVSMRVMDMAGRLVKDHGSREHSGIQRELQASRDQTDLNSEEGMIMKAWEAQSISLQRQAIPGRVDGMNDMLVPGQSREMLDLDSMEDNNLSLAAVDDNKQADYDESRGYMSSETYPVAPPEQRARNLPAPPKSHGA